MGGQQPDTALRDSQVALLKFGGVQENEMQFNDININDTLKKMATKSCEDGRRPFPFRLNWELREVQDNYIQETVIANANKEAPHLLMLHGYGCSGALFYKMVGDLKAYFNITLIDFLGMGCSGRPEYSTSVISTPQLAIDYFVISTEAWMIKSGYKNLVGDKGCTIIGHSFGGYIAAWYTVSEYAKGFVKSLILLSPAGVPRQPQLTEEQQAEQERTKDAIDDSAEVLWQNNFNIISLIRGGGSFLASQIIRGKMHLTNRITDEDEQDLFVEFQKQQLLRFESSELVMGTIFHVKAWAYMPVMDLIDTGKLKHIPTLILYGDGEEDWLWSNVLRCHDTLNSPVSLENLSYLESILQKGNSKLSQSEIFHPKSKLIHLKNSGHQIMVDNPVDANHAILDFTHSKETADGYKDNKQSHEKVSHKNAKQKDGRNDNKDVQNLIKERRGRTARRSKNL